MTSTTLDRDTAPLSPPPAGRPGPPVADPALRADPAAPVRPGRLNGTTHTCLGQEYVPVALRPLLDEEEDVVNLGLAYDHRFVNGRDAVLFLQAVRELLEAPDVPDVPDVHVPHVLA